MPELPDVVVYVERAEALLAGRRLLRARLGDPFVLRSVEPPPAAFENLFLRAVRRLGKRIVLEFDNERYLVVHLMIAGRLRWKRAPPSLAPRSALASLDFEHGSLLLTEAASKRRASLHAVEGRAALERFRPEGVEPLEASLDEFVAALRRENHTLKRALTDPRIVSGVGNAYSDEILHRARLSPVRLTSALSDAEIATLRDAARDVLGSWTERLRAEAGAGFPEKVTAFREGMAVHGRFGLPCPVCGTLVQRIRRAESESNYCPRCQTGGKMLADRALSRLLHADWPRTIDEWEDRMTRSAAEPSQGAGSIDGRAP